MKNTNKEIIVIINESGFELDWHVTYNIIPIESYTRQQRLYEEYIKNPSKLLYTLGFSKENTDFSVSLNYLRIVSKLFIEVLSKNPDIEILKENTEVILEENELEIITNAIPFIDGTKYITRNWIETIWNDLHLVFREEITAFKGTVSEYFLSKNADIQPVGRVFFHLVENKKDEYPFAFLATYSTRVTEGGKSKHLPLKNALIEYKGNTEKLLELLSTVKKVASSSELIDDLLDSGDIFEPIGLTVNEAYTFLKEIPLYETSGILCRIPKWWRNKSESIKLSISVGSKEPSKVGLTSIVDFDASILIGGENLSIEELKKLLTEAEGLAFIKGKWVEVNHEKLKQTLEAYEKAQKTMNNGEMSILEALRFQMDATRVLDITDDDSEVEITNGDWLKSIFEKMSDPQKLDSIACGNDFYTKLRPYQEKGLNWLYYMKTLGLGACLADDMGLGKTIQILALLNNIKHDNKEKTILIVPASLIGNWVTEINKFTPTLKYYVLHTSENKNLTENDILLLKQYDLFITTYGMIQRYEWPKKVTWDMIIIDEAQAIKNPGTKQTKAIKQLEGRYRIAMTGTPIENRLSDLWSLFDFLNKGVLGTANEFTKYTKKITQMNEGYSRLKSIVAPFILRRLKTDKSVIADLPEKIEMKTYASLSKKQCVLYNSIVNELKEKIEKTEGIERKGLVLSTIMKLKQICNHPDQYLGQEIYLEKESGKYERLKEICETIYEKRERVLVFTQFKEITKNLNDFLFSIFGHEGLILHGETPVKKRKELVDRFQGKDYVPFMVLSIKAGGVGLNLTNANHVIHFDRWWNPAVENQATDRAFRIGQKKNVIVHKFITTGTIEEKIDSLIEEKVKLQNEIISDTNESWITEMSNEALMDMFKLEI